MTTTQTVEIIRERKAGNGLRGLLLGQRPRSIILVLAGLILLASVLLHIQIILTTTGASYDILSYRIQADSVFLHKNVYEYTHRYPYPPLWIWIITLLRWVSITLHLRFDALAKLPPTFGDLGAAIVLLLYSYRRFGWCVFALIPFALYALNPVALIIGAGHGQFDSLVIFFILLGIYLHGARQDQHAVWSALALGMAIALKGYPVLALPYFMFSAPRGARIRTAIVAFVPLVVSILIYCALFGFSPMMLSRVVGYRSTPDFGWGGFLQFSQFSALYPVLGPRLATVLQICIMLFALVVPPLWFRNRPASAMTVLFAAFYALTFSMNVQYLVWILPFICLAFPIWSLVYTIAGLYAIAHFYIVYYPTAVPSGLWLSLLAPFNISRSHSAAILLGVSACIALYTVCVASSVAGAIQARLPFWIRRVVAALQPFQVDGVPATAAPVASAEEWRDETVPTVSTTISAG